MFGKVAHGVLSIGFVLVFLVFLVNVCIVFIHPDSRHTLHLKDFLNKASQTTTFEIPYFNTGIVSISDAYEAEGLAGIILAGIKNLFNVTFGSVLNLVIFFFNGVCGIITFVTTLFRLFLGF